MLARELILHVLDHQTSSRHIECHFFSFYLFVLILMIVMSWITKLAENRRTLSVILFQFLFVLLQLQGATVLDKGSLCLH